MALREKKVPGADCAIFPHRVDPVMTDPVQGRQKLLQAVSLDARQHARLSGMDVLRRSSHANAG